MKKFLIVSLLAASSASFVACSDDDDNPPVEGEAASSQFYAYGEPFIEEGIPATAFADGWAVTFSEFVVTVTEAGLEGAGPWSETDASALYVDVSKPGNESAAGTPVGSVETTTSKTYDKAFYTIAPSTIGNNVNVLDATVTEMQADGASVLVRGTATKGEDSINFDWALDSSSTYSPCEIEAFSPIASEETRVELTIHGDHLFYDSLSSEDPDLVFQVFADADADSDGTVTIGELDAVQVADTSLSAAGSDDVKTLLDFVTFQSTTLGHINGEGHCD